jgi:glycosyltransferase involved in cell wall biosynthesis
VNKKLLTLSIVIPAYNEEDHLKACLDAIANQTVKPLEVIVVDNNSTDKTAALARKYQFVTLLKEKKQGIAFARNKGFNTVKADIIGRIDADTIIPPDWVEYAVKFITAHSDSLLTGGGYFYDLGLPRSSGWFMEQFAFRANRFILGYYIAWGSNMVMRRELWEAVKKDVHNDPGIHEDMDLAIHLHARGYIITYHTDWKVGVDSRVKARPREMHMDYLRPWPRTLRFHELPRAWMGDAGRYVVYWSWWPIIAANWVVEQFKGSRK